jgi:predicted small secreted protein
MHPWKPASALLVSSLLLPACNTRALSGSEFR